MRSDKCSLPASVEAEAAGLCVRVGRAEGHRYRPASQYSHPGAAQPGEASAADLVSVEEPQQRKEAELELVLHFQVHLWGGQISTCA